MNETERPRTLKMSSVDTNVDVQFISYAITAYLLLHYVHFYIMILLCYIRLNRNIDLSLSRGAEGTLKMRDMKMRKTFF